MNIEIRDPRTTQTAKVCVNLEQAEGPCLLIDHGGESPRAYWTIDECRMLRTAIEGFLAENA